MPTSQEESQELTHSLSELNIENSSKPTTRVHFSDKQQVHSYNLGNDQEIALPTQQEIMVISQDKILTPTAVAELSAQQSRLSCRFYENRFPEVDSLVVVNVRQIADMGAYVHLLEYNNIEGMILLSELSRRRIRSIQKLIRVGRNEVAVVLRVDKEKGYIDLSKRRVAAEDVVKCEERFQKSKQVQSIMRLVAEKLNMSLEELHSSYTWPLYKKYGHAFDAFKISLAEPERIFGEFVDMPPHVKKEILSHIRKRLTPQPVKIRADIECTCFGYEGIDAVKAALKAGEAHSNDKIAIKIKLVAPPLYVMVTQSLDKAGGIQALEEAIVSIEKSIKASDGSLTVKMKPRAVSEHDDLELQQLMAKMEKENAEISGDESGDEGQGGVEDSDSEMDDDEDEEDDI